ncbi:hypothetical protein GJ496_005620 [Pomphorhynchus laevis]|nr:hypothetical protein GJ496_005620 [Pomphorhynchus laevis]
MIVKRKSIKQKKRQASNKSFPKKNSEETIKIDDLEKLKCLLENKQVKLVHLKKVVKAFTAVVTTKGNVRMKDVSSVDCRVFNEVIRLCLEKFIDKVLEHLGVKHPLTERSNKKLRRSDNWNTTKSTLRKFLSNLILLCDGLTEPGVISLILRYIRNVSALYLNFSNLSLKLIRLLIGIWSTSKSTENRLCAFFCLHRIGCADHDTYEIIIKRMFKAFVANTKFTSEKTLRDINLMSICFIEMCRIDCEYTYQHCFSYIRQLSIQLRNAIRDNNQQECAKSICTWQYVHSIHLFSRLVAEIDDPAIRLFIHPIVQIVMGLVRFFSSSSFYPLRFHCVRMLICICKGCQVYIPVLPLILDIFRTFDFNRKPKSAMIKKIDFSISLKCSEQALHDKSFTEALVDEIYDAVITYLAIYAHSITFPELVFPLKSALQKVSKSCTNGNTRKIFKGLYDRIMENSKTIDSRRNRNCIDLRDVDEISKWQRVSEADPTPLSIYYEKYSELRKKEKNEESTFSFNLDCEHEEKDEIHDNKIKAINPPTVAVSNKRKNKIKIIKKSEFKKNHERAITGTENAQIDECPECSDIDDEMLPLVLSDISDDETSVTIKQ